ncbi:MAG TPA: hypothetical protein VIV06_03125, partial [Candidatus Limnocylindrales bacterium]
TSLGTLGRTYEGSGAIEAGLRLAERHGLAVTALRARLNHGYLQSKVDARTTLESDRVGLADARRLGQRTWAVMFVTNASASAVWTGDWNWTLEQLAEALTGELEREDRFQVLGRIGIIRGWQGESTDAILDEMERLVGPTPDPNHGRFLVEVRAARAFALGRFGDVTASLRRLAGVDPGNARHYRVLSARAALLERDAVSAAADLEALEAIGVHGSWTRACRTSIRAGLAALDGRPADALSLYREALRDLADAGLPFDQALTTIEMASLLDPAVPEVRAASEAAREILARLGARSLLERLEAAMGRSPEGDRVPDRPEKPHQSMAGAPP